MSTGKIGRTLNPRSKVTPGYTSAPEKQEVKRHELLEKLDEVLLSVKDEFQPLLKSLEKQNLLVVKLSEKVENLDIKVNNLQKENSALKAKLSNVEEKLCSIDQNCETILKNSEQSEEEVEAKKGWFK